MILGLFVLFTRGPKTLVPLGDDDDQQNRVRQSLIDEHAQPPRRMSLANVVIALGVLALVGFVIAVRYGNHESSGKAQTAVNDNSSAAQAISWSYSQNEDNITGKTIKEATIRSKDPVEFSFPYGGAQYPHLIVRTHPR